MFFLKGAVLLIQYFKEGAGILSVLFKMDERDSYLIVSAVFEVCCVSQDEGLLLDPSQRFSGFFCLFFLGHC